MATLNISPNAAGDETAIPSQYPTTAYHWEKVDDTPGSPDDNGSYVYTNSAGYVRDLYTLADPSGSGTINFIKVHYRFKSIGGTGYCKPAVKTGGTVYEGSEDTENAASWKSGEYQWTNNPDTGVAWTWDDLSSLQAGIAMHKGTSYVDCTQVYVEIDYTDATAQVSTDAGTGSEATESLQITVDKTAGDAGSGGEDAPSANGQLAGNETGGGIEGAPLPGGQMVGAENGGGADALGSLQSEADKMANDTGNGAEAAPLSSREYTGNETGTGADAALARWLAGLDTAGGTDASICGGDGAEALAAAETGRGQERRVACIEIPGKGGEMKLWT